MCLLLEFQDQLHRLRGREMPWERPAALRAARARSEEDILAALDDADPNTRIVAARLLGVCDPACFGELRPVIVEKLHSLLDDRSTHQYAYGEFQCEEDEPPVAVADIAACSLAQLFGNAGYGQVEKPTPSRPNSEVARTEVVD